MPIRPENRNRYPADWPEIRARILRRAGNRCEACGVAGGALGGRLPDGTWCPAHPTGTDGARLTWPGPGSDAWCRSPGGGEHQLRILRIVLTIAHLDHTPEHCQDDNLRAWCQRCHNRHDARHRAAGIRRRRRAS
ncbi:MAG: hypothetical protein VW338_18000, partial [Rhodospirillaceae bacterium]